MIQSIQIVKEADTDRLQVDFRIPPAWLATYDKERKMLLDRYRMHLASCLTYMIELELLRYEVVMASDDESAETISVVYHNPKAGTRFCRTSLYPCGSPVEAVSEEIIKALAGYLPMPVIPQPPRWSPVYISLKKDVIHRC